MTKYQGGLMAVYGKGEQIIILGSWREGGTGHMRLEIYKESQI